MDCGNRQLNSERRAMTFSVAVHRHCSAMRFHDMADNGQPEAKAAILSCPAGVGLRESLKYMWDEFDIDAFSVIGNRNAKFSADSAALDCYFAASVRKLNGIGQEIPENLLNAFRVCEYWLSGILNFGQDVNPFRCGCREC